MNEISGEVMEKYVKQYQNNIERREKLPKTALEYQNRLKPPI